MAYFIAKIVAFIVSAALMYGLIEWLTHKLAPKERHDDHNHRHWDDF